MNTSNIEYLFSASLAQTATAISYSVSKELARLFPDRYVLETESDVFDLEEFGSAGHCMATLKSGIHNQLTTAWRGADYDLNVEPTQAWHSVVWQDHEFEVVRQPKHHPSKPT